MLLVEALGRVTADLEAQEGRKGPYLHFSLAVKKAMGNRSMRRSWTVGLLEKW